MIQAVLDQMFEHLAGSMSTPLVQLDDSIDSPLVRWRARRFHGPPIRFRLADEATKPWVDVEWSISGLAISRKMRIHYMTFVVGRRIVSGHLWYGQLAGSTLAVRGGIGALLRRCCSTRYVVEMNARWSSERS
jgi:hypothetical protein